MRKKAGGVVDVARTGCRGRGERHPFLDADARSNPGSGRRRLSGASFALGLLFGSALCPVSAEPGSSSAGAVPRGPSPEDVAVSGAGGTETVPSERSGPSPPASIIDGSPLLSPAPAPAPLGDAPFRVFNTMLYAGMPSLGRRVPVAYEQTFFGDNEPRADGQPSDAGIAAAVADTRGQRGPPWFADEGFAIVDVERWHVWPFADAAVHEESVARYAGTVSRYADALGEPVCLYAIVPQAGINYARRAVSEPDVRAEWDAASAVARERLVPEVDALCPSLYTYYDAGDDPEGRRAYIEEWKRFAIETIAEARRIAPDVPVYPFLWPQFHPGGNMTGFGFLPEDYWRAQLEVVREHADGLILWGGWNFADGGQLDWDPDARWYRVFREYFPHV